MRAGANYGWPNRISGTYRNADYRPPDIAGPFEEPKWAWADRTVAPTGMVVYSGSAFPEWRGDLLLAGLSRGYLMRLDVEEDRIVRAEYLLEHMTDVQILAIDLAKRSFQVCGTALGGAVLFNRMVSRGKLETILREQSPCIVAMEACASGNISYTIRDWLVAGLMPLSSRDGRRDAMRERVTAQLAGQLTGDPQLDQAVIEQELGEQARNIGRQNVSRAISDLVKAGLVTRHHAGYSTHHANRGAGRYAVDVLSPEAMEAFGKVVVERPPDFSHRPFPPLCQPDHFSAPAAR